MRWQEITEIEQMSGDWSEGIQEICARYIDDAEPYTRIGDLEVKKSVDRAITALLFYDRETLIGYTMLTDDNAAPGAVEVEIAFEKSHQKRGIGYATYLFLLNSGYTIVSGFNQYPGAVAIWKKLIADPSVKVLAVYPNDINSSTTRYTTRKLKSPSEPWTTENQYLRLLAKK